MITKIKILFLIFFLCEKTLDAKEVRHLVRSPKALLMGDAFTSLVDDEYMLFYNPASIGKTFGVYLTPVNPDLGATNALNDQDRFKDLPKTAAGLSDRFMGYPVYLHGGISPGIRFGPFAFNFFLNNSTSLVLRNAVHPFVDIDYRYDRGFVFGYAYTFGKGGKKNSKTKRKTAPPGRRTSIGVSFKNINREGIAENLSLFSTRLLNEIAASGNDTDRIKRSLGYSKGSGWGGDLGIEHALVKGSTEFTAAFSILDIANTKISVEEGTRKLPSQEMSVNTGVSFKQDFLLFDYSLSLDLHPLNQPIDMFRKFHLGFQAGIPLVRVFAGLSEGYPSYGLGFRLWPIEIVAGFYSVELGTKFGEQEGKRGVVYLNLLEISFDIM